MYGVLGQPYLDLEPFVDVAPLIALHGEIAFGLAQHEPPRTETGSYRWKEEPLVDVWTKILELRSGQNEWAKRKLEELVAASGGAYHKAYLFTQLMVGGYTGSRTLLLKFNRGGYFQKNNSAGSIWLPPAQAFPGLLKYIETLPFTEIGQIAIYMTESGCAVPNHQDLREAQGEFPNEFIWFSPQANKPLYMFDEIERIKIPVKSRAIFFNELDFHGVEPVPHVTYSVRIDGRFTKEFRRRIGIDELRMPALRD